MTVVSIRALQEHLSEYVERVKAGEEVTVTEDGVPVAQLTRVKAKEDERARMERLAAQGLVRLGKGKLPDDFWTRPRPHVEGNAAVEALLADREERDDALLGCVGRDPDLRG